MFLATVIDQIALLAGAFLLGGTMLSLIRMRRVHLYPIPFAFFLCSVVSSLVFASHTTFGWLTRSQYSRLYWGYEFIEQGFALSLMVVVVRLAAGGEKSTAVLSQGMASVVVVLMAAFLTEDLPSYESKWMTGFTRNLSFGVALMNFHVWGLLISKRVKNREVLLLAAGLGLLTTGKSLGHTFRIVATPGGWALLIGNYIVVATGIAAAIAWWYAFKRRKAPEASPRGKIQLVKAA